MIRCTTPPDGCNNKNPFDACPFVTLRYHAQEICRTLVCRLNALIKTLEDGGGATGNLWRYVVATLGSNDLGLSSDNEDSQTA